MIDVGDLHWPDLGECMGLGRLQSGIWRVILEFPGSLETVQ